MDNSIADQQMNQNDFHKYASFKIRKFSDAIAKLESHRTFFQECIANGVIPKGLRLRF